MHSAVMALWYSTLVNIVSSARRQRYKFKPLDLYSQQGSWLVKKRQRLQEAARLGRGVSDPAMFLLPTDQQFRRDYVFLTPDTYFVDYVTVITEATNEIILNDAPLDLTGALPIPNSNFVYKHISLPKMEPRTYWEPLPSALSFMPMMTL